MMRSGGLPWSTSPAHLRTRWQVWLRNPLGVDGVTNGEAMFLMGVLAIVAIGFGGVTVAIGELFSTRPIFYLALPIVVILAMVVVMSPQKLLIGLVVLRAILDPIFQRATLPGIGGLGGLLNFVIIGLALTLLAIERGKEMSRESWLPWIPFIVVMAIAIVRSPDRVFALRGWLSLLTYAAVYHGAFYCVKNLVEFDRLLRWLLLSAVPVFIYAIVSYLFFGASYTLEAGDGTSARLSDPLAHPNILAFYTVVMLGGWLMKVKARPKAPTLTLRHIAWSLYLLMLLAMLAGTQTRSAWFGALFLVLVYGVLVKRIYLVFIVAGAMLSLLIPDVRDRIVDLGSGNEVYTYSRLNSFAWRQYLWSSAIGVMSPLAFLVGNGGSAFYTGSIAFFPLAGGMNWAAHNVYVQLLFDTGAVGVAAYLAIFVMAIRVVWSRKTLPRDTRIACLSLLVCFAVMSYSDNMLDYLVVNWNCWFLIGLVVASATTLEETAKAARPVRRTPGARPLRA